MELGTMLSIGSSLLGALGSGDSKQQTTQQHTPWGPTQGWLTNNMKVGQDLQNQYMAQPLSPAQQQAYANSFNSSGLGRSVGLNFINGMMGNKFFDRNNPLERPAPLSMGLLGSGEESAPAGGGLGDLSQYLPKSAPAAAVAPAGDSAELQALLARFPSSLHEAVRTSSSAYDDPVWAINPMWALSNGGTRNPNFPNDRTANPQLPAFSPQKYGTGVYDAA